MEEIERRVGDVKKAERARIQQAAMQVFMWSFFFFFLYNSRGRDAPLRGDSGWNTVKIKARPKPILPGKLIILGFH